MIVFSRSLVIVFAFFIACKTPVKMGKPLSPGSQTYLTRNVSGMTHELLTNILQKSSAQFQSMLSYPAHKIQIIYTQVDRKKSGDPVFIDHYFNVSDTSYFYPASTVKLPVAILALQKLNELGIAGLDKKSTMITEASYNGQNENYNDPTAPDGRPTIEHYIKKILLVSDNDAFNRLYEFLGQEYINNTLHKMGYEDVQIVHRLDVSLTEDENRHTNPVRFFATSGKLVYEKALKKSDLVYANRNTKMGKGFYRSGELINEPFDFSQKNRMSLKTLHNIVRSVMFPGSVAKKQQFKLNDDDLDLLRRYMSMMPTESDVPVYHSDQYWDSYVKFLYYGKQKNITKPGIRIFNKVGNAYGFLTDAIYFADFENNVEFLLSATIHCNSDGIYNDNKYDYDNVGYPFMMELGRVIYDHELKRSKKVIPNLDKFRYNYTP